MADQPLCPPCLSLIGKQLVPLLIIPYLPSSDQGQSLFTSCRAAAEKEEINAEDITEERFTSRSLCSVCTFQEEGDDTQWGKATVPLGASRTVWVG